MPPKKTKKPFKFTLLRGARGVSYLLREVRGVSSPLGGSGGGLGGVSLEEGTGNTSKPCPYCLPTIRHNHFDTHLDYYSAKFSNLLSRLLKPFILNPKLEAVLEKYLFLTLFKTLTFFRIISWVELNLETEKNFSNRILLTAKELQKLGWKVKFAKLGKKPSDVFWISKKIQQKTKKFYYKALPISSNKAPFDLDNKQLFQDFLNQNKLNQNPSKSFKKIKPALKFTKEIGYPVAIKPVYGSLSQHVFLDLKNELELKKFIPKVLIYQPEFLIEKYVLGRMFRITVIAQKEVFVCEKDKPNVVGDGKNSIQNLIQLKNQTRAKLDIKNSTLHQIQIDQEILQTLKKQNLELDSVPKKEQKVYLKSKLTLANGCDIIEKTDLANLEIKKLFLNIAKKLNLDLVGFDLICEDIQKDLKKQKYHILEANTLPYLNMHDEPFLGKPAKASQFLAREVDKNPSRFLIG